MPFILLLLIVIALVFGPGWWVKHVLKKYSRPRDDLPGTGGELAEHLIERFQLTDVQLEQTDRGDHYDPEKKAIRLTQPVMTGKSLTSVATAAHEFGHALQHARNYTALTTRTLLVKRAQNLQTIAGAAIFLIPVLAAIPGLAVATRLLLIAIIASMFVTTLIHLITLPVEFDASFGRAMPILQQGQYVSNRDLMTVRKILLACALTYVSQSLISILNIGRWIRILRR
jgi:Zn-dependent membrane protease YugP